MRRRIVLAVFPLLLAASCGDKDKNASIEHMNTAVDLVEKGSYQTAQKELEYATSLYKENHLAWYQLGQVYLKRTEGTRDNDQLNELWKKAAEAFSEAVKYSPGDAMYHYHLGHSLYEQSKYGQGNLNLAQSELEEALRLNKRLFKAYYFLGHIHAVQDRPKEAAEAWTEACKLNPYFGKPFIELGKLYLMWDFVPQAISVLSQGAVNARDPIDLTDLYYHLGLAYDADKNWDKAIEAYTNALAHKRDNLDAKRQRGFSYANKGDKAKAIADLEEFVKQGGGGNTLAIQAANDRLIRLRIQ